MVMMNKKDIADNIYRQMMQDNHFYCENGSGNDDRKHRLLRATGTGRRCLFPCEGALSVGFYSWEKGFLGGCIF
ncbi:hypothetical protein C3L56_01015 [Veillonellaceae bacterium M2-4]|nr:hypothetical protein [Veillonellaceae bacterium M2-4]